MWMAVKFYVKFTWSYIKYFLYGFKHRVCALFKRQIGILDFFKSLFKLPFEAWYLSRIDYQEGYL